METIAIKIIYHKSRLPFPSSLEQRDQNTILLYVLIRGSEVSHRICSKYNGIFIDENNIFINENNIFINENNIFINENTNHGEALASNYSSSYVHLTYI
jgi:hypothetical protein